MSAAGLLAPDPLRGLPPLPPDVILRPPGDPGPSFRTWRLDLCRGSGLYVPHLRLGSWICPPSSESIGRALRRSSEVPLTEAQAWNNAAGLGELLGDVWTYRRMRQSSKPLGTLDASEVGGEIRDLLEFLPHKLSTADTRSLESLRATLERCIALAQDRLVDIDQHMKRQP